MEVKYRKLTLWDFPKSGEPPEAAADQSCGSFYLTEHSLAENRIRFDVIAILGEKITHLEDAFEYQDDEIGKKQSSRIKRCRV